MEKTTAIISIPQCVASHTLKSLNDNNIPCHYQGIDPSGRIVMKMDYQSSQEKFLTDLIKDMEESEKSINLLFEVGSLIIMNEVVKSRATSLLKQK